jgi:hypothetical protein
LVFVEKKYFSVEDAQKALPRVRRLLSRLHKLKLEINFLAEEREAPFELDEPASEDEAYRFAFAQEIKLNRVLHKAIYEFFKTLDQLNEIGCVVKDLDEGLIDFYSRLNDREVMLCWKEGEDSIRHWHEIETGFAGRNPIIDLDDYYERQS